MECKYYSGTVIKWNVSSYRWLSRGSFEQLGDINVCLLLGVSAIANYTENSVDSLVDQAVFNYEQRPINPLLQLNDALGTVMKR